jgi:O-antigen ligase/Flp pilus assembly protein TadD
MSRGTWATAAPPLLRWLGLILAAGWLGYYICSGMPQVYLHVFSRTITLHALTFTAAVVYAGYLFVRRRLPGGSPLDWPLALLLIAYLMATAASVDPRVSFESMTLLFMAVLVFYVLSDLDFLDALSLQRGLMLAGAAASVWALWYVAVDYKHWLDLARATGGGFHLGDLIPPTVPKVHGVSDHPNILGMTLVLIIPFYVVAAYRSPSRWERWGAAAALLAAAWAVFLTLSRGAWIGALAGAAATIAAVVLTTQAWPREALQRTDILRRLRQRRSLLLVAGAQAAAVVVILAAVLLATRWEARPQWLFRESLSPRQDVFEAGIDMFGDHPLLGAGPGTFGLLYPQYSGEYPVHAIHAHNGYLQVAVDAGLVGLAALAVLAGVLAWLLWRSYRSGSTRQRLLVAACGGALAGFAVHNLADAANYWKAPLIAVAAVLAISVRNYQDAPDAAGPPPAADDPPRPALSRWARLLPRILMVVAMVSLFVVWGKIDAAHYHYSESLDDLANGRTFDAISEARSAADMDPDLAIYQLQLGLTEGLAFTQEGLAAFLQQSIEHLRRGVELEPRSAIGYANLARALALEGADEEAEAAALKAQSLAGADATVLLAAGNVLEDIGATEEAVETYGMAVTRMSQIADSVFWTGSQFRRDHYDEILQHSILALSPCAEGYLLTRAGTESPLPATVDRTKLLDDCTLHVLGDPNDLNARIDLAEMLMAAGDLSAAFDQIDFAVKRQPDFGRARTALGVLYAVQDDTDRARKEWTLAGQLDDAEALVLLGDSYPPGQVPPEVVDRLQKLAPLTAGGARFYLIGILYYRMKFARESPSTILLPGDWQDAVPGEYEKIEQALERWRTGA